MSLFADRRFSLFVALSFTLVVGLIAVVSHQSPDSWLSFNGAYREWDNRVAINPTIRESMSGPLRPATLASAITHGRGARPMDLYVDSATR